MLPSPYVRGDDQRMTFAYFCLSALDLLQQVHDVVDEKERNEYIDWVYDQQMSADQGGGFRGSPAASTVRTARDMVARTHDTIRDILQ